MSGDDEANAGETGDVNTAKASDPRAASRYALQLALQTMKERCQHFQNRLSAVEEENLQLHLERLHCNVKESKSDTARLEEQIAQLTQQKSQLTHHIFMVATENKQLWTRLSRLTEANQSLGSHLTKISETLNSHSAVDISKPSQSINIVNSCDKESKEPKDESLEEISLKLINNIMREKMDLEQQYDQMVELQTNAMSMEDCEFTLNNGNGGLEIESGETEDLLQDIRRVAEKLKEEKEILMQQQAGLKAAMAIVSNAVKISIPCSTCQKIKQESNTVANQQRSSFATYQTRLDGLDRQLKQISEPHTSHTDNEIYLNDTSDENSMFLGFEDRICPLCAKFYHKSTKFEEFNQHVLSHFSSEQDIESMGTYEFLA